MPASHRLLSALDSGIHRFNEFAGTGDPIVADLKLRVVPMSATFRFLPLGHHEGVQPYIGAGAGVFAWRYSESGDFVASDNRTIIHGNFRRSGTATGPVVLGGVRVPIGSVGVRRGDQMASRRRATCRRIRTSPGRRSISAAGPIRSR